MIIIVETIDLNILQLPEKNNILFCFYTTNEEKIKNLIRNNRVRTIFDKTEVKNMFNLTEKLQIVKAKKIQVKPYDKIVAFQKNGKFAVLEAVEIEKYYKSYLLLKEDLTKEK